MVSTDRRTDVFLFSALFVVVVSVIVLGIAQLSWVRKSSETEANRLRETMVLKGAAAIRAAVDESWYLFELWREAALRSDGISTEGLYRYVWQEWSANSEHPDLLNAMFDAVLNTDGTWAVRRFDPAAGDADAAAGDADAAAGDGDPAAGDADAAAGGGDPAAGDADAAAGSFVPATDQEAQRLKARIQSERDGSPQADFLIPLRTPEGSRFQAVFVDINEMHILRSVIPEQLNEGDVQYGVVIRDDEGAVLYSNGVERAADADVRLPIDLFRPVMSRAPGVQDDRATNPAPEDAETNRFSVVTDRYRWLGAPDRFRTLEGRRQPTTAVLELYLPGRSVEAYRRHRTLINAGFASAVLVLVLIALTNVFALYRQSRRLLLQQREFVAVTGHELRTPVTVVRSAADNLRGGYIRDPEKVKSYGQSIVRNTDRLSRGIDNIMLFAGLQSRRSGGADAPIVDLRALLSQTVHDLKGQAQEAQAHLNAAVEVTAEAYQIDPEVIVTVVENLVRNAILHAVPYCTDDKRTVDLLVKDLYPDHIRIQVADQGPGLSRSERRRVFEPFVRGHRSNSDQIPGHGLGLHIVDRIVRTEGGTITVQSPVPGAGDFHHPGARFTVTLPVHRANGESHR